MAKRRCKDRQCPLIKGIEVPYAGNTKAKIVLCGESPGFDEERYGKPFKGQSGKLGRRIAKSVGLNWSSLFVINSARCRIDKKKLSTKEQTAALSHCRRYVVSALNNIQPKLVLLFGDFALQQIMRKKGITKARGKFVWLDEFKCWALPTFHPSYILRNPAMEQVLRRDMKQVVDFIKNNYEPPSAKDSKDTTDYHVVGDLREVIKEACYTSVDTEGQGLDTISPNFVMLSYSVSDKHGRAYNVNMYEEAPPDDCDFTIEWMRAPEGKKKKELTTVGVRKCKDFDVKLEGLKWYLANPDIKKCMHHGAFDVHAFDAFFRRLDMDWELKGWVFDTQSAANVLDENIFQLASLTQIQLFYSDFKFDYNGEFDSKFDKSDMLGVPVEDRDTYAMFDADVTRRGAMTMRKQFAKTPSLAHYYAKVVHPTIVKTLIPLEAYGAWIDPIMLPQTTEEVGKRVLVEQDKALKLIPKAVKERELHKKKGLKLTRPDLVRDTLFLHEKGFKLKITKLTASKDPSTNKNVRKDLKAGKLTVKARKFIEHYDEWSELNTLYTRYLKGFQKWIKADGRIHSSFTNAMTVTGRISCLTGDTRISVLDERGRVPISRIVTGDWIWAFDSNLKPVPAQVSASQLTLTNADLVEVSFMTQGRRRIKTIRCTPDHPFRLLDGSYKKAEHLSKGDRVLALEGKLFLRLSWPKVKRLLAHNFNHMIVGVRKLKVREDVYDITVPVHSNFIANGVCVHNSSKPNMMNNPKRSKSAHYIRQLIASSPGWVFLAADESQSELRWASHVSNCLSMMEVFRQGADLHRNTAMSMVTKPWDQLTETEQKKARQQAKPVNFGMLFMMSAFGLVNYAKTDYGVILTEKQAQHYINVWFNLYPELRTYHRNTIAFCKKHGYVVSPLGRRRRLPKINSQDKWMRAEAERMAVNHPIQSPSSDIVLMACNKLNDDDVIDPDVFFPVMFIHDELIFQVRESADHEMYGRVVKNAMENPPLHTLGVELKVPLVSDLTIGPNLAQMRDFPL